MRDIGKNILDLRSKRNMTQDELAEKLFVTRQTVSNYETGRSRPDLDMLVKIAEVLECDTNAILFGTAEGQQQERDKLRFWIGLGIFVLIQGLLLWLTPIAKEQMLSQFKLGMYWLIQPLLTVPKWITVGWLLVQMLRGLLKPKVPRYGWMPIARRLFVGFLIFAILYTAIPGADASFGTGIGRTAAFQWVNKILQPLQYWVMAHASTFAIAGILLNFLGFPKNREKTE